jgi:salicylate hydroxylase
VGEAAGITPDQPELSILTAQLNPLLCIAFNLNGDTFAVSRIVLHRILTIGLEDVIHYDHRYDYTETLDTGKLRVHFTNGKFADGDFLVAADGINSAVRKQFLPPSFQPVKYGPVGMVGKVFIDDPSTFDFQPVERGICIVMSGEGRGVFVAPQRYSAEAKAKICELFAGVTDGVTHEAQLAPNATGEELLLVGGDQKQKLIDDARDYVFYGYITTHLEDFGISGMESMKDFSQRGLLDAVLMQMRTRNWSPKLIDLCEKTEVNTVGYWLFQVCPLISTLAGHKPLNVTFIGDSIHASSFSLAAKCLTKVPPSGGEGGNNALRDAGQLTQCLVKVFASKDGQDVLPGEVSAYENEMFKLSSVSIRTSMRNSNTITAEGWVYPYFIQFALRVVNFFFGLKKKA